MLARRADLKMRRTNLATRLSIGPPRKGHTNVVETLLQAGANIEARDAVGQTPLQTAINTKEVAVAELLLASRAAITPDEAKRLATTKVAISSIVPAKLD